MAASYPGSVKTFVTRIDGAGNIIFAAHMNDVQDEINAVESGLLSGFAHALRPDASANNRDIGLTGARFRDLFLARTIDQALGTITTDIQGRTVTVTWNAGGVTFTLDKVVVTDTASDAASKFVEYLVDAASKFAVRKDGRLTLAEAVVATAAILGTTPATVGIVRIPNNQAIAARNAGNTADINLISLSAADLIAFGGTVAQFSLNVDPTTALQPATKQYVDNNAGNVKTASGSGAGNYTTTSSSFVAVDGTNLAPAIVVPTGFTAVAIFHGRIDAPAGGSHVGIDDGAGNVRHELTVAGSGFTHFAAMAFQVGDGTSRTFRAIFKSVTATQTTTIQNGTSTDSPRLMVFFLKTGA